MRETLEKVSPRVPEKARLDDDHAFDGCPYDIHSVLFCELKVRLARAFDFPDDFQQVLSVLGS